MEPPAISGPEGRPRNKPPIGRRFQKGESGNPSGRPKALRDIERMLDAEHRTVDNMREVFGRLKALALGEPVTVAVPGGEGETRIDLRAEPAFMKLYLERVIGPVKDIEPDLGDAPPEVLDYLRKLQ